jgi:hypothetical protein
MCAKTLWSWSYTEQNVHFNVSWYQLCAPLGREAVNPPASMTRGPWDARIHAGSQHGLLQQLPFLAETPFPVPKDWMYLTSCQKTQRLFGFLICDHHEGHLYLHSWGISDGRECPLMIMVTPVNMTAPYSMCHGSRWLQVFHWSLGESLHQPCKVI